MIHIRRASAALVLVMLFSGAMAQTAKFGHVHSTYVMTKIPEYTEAMETLTKLDSTYSSEIERLGVEINNKIDQFNKDTISPQVIMETKAQEIQGLQMRAQQFQQNAEQDLQQQQAILFAPIQEKVINAINAIAQENDLVYVFDVAGGNPIYISDQSLDLVPLLFERFGIEYDPNELMELGY